MNKSTPLTQLPTSQSQQQQPQFVNDQHRQLITQAHTAAQNFTMPVNTQLGGDYSREEDATIQETLMHLNGSDSSAHPTSAIQQLPPLSQPSSSHTPSAMPTPMSAPLPMPMPMSSPMPMPMPTSGNMSMPMTSYAYPHANQALEPWWSFMGDSAELKLVAIVILITLALSLVPFERLVVDYLPSMISKLPYSEVVGRALAAGALFYVSQAVLT